MSTVLITGGTGFLGKRLGKRFREMGHRVILSGRNNKLNFQAESFAGCPSVSMDVSRIESVRDTVTEFKPDVIIHAAATKFVDRAELFPHETVDINVVGSQNVARVAIEKGVGLVIGISTDKAAPPVRNTYGLTKALMERLFCSLEGKSATHFVCVRYGNVAWSTGSVLCLWNKMLRETGVIETTGPAMTRFFFTVDNAVELVATAYAHRDELGGKVLSREMKAAQMEEILRVWTRQEGKRYKKVEGRPGERNEEFLIGEAELPFTEVRRYNDLTHYVIAFNQKARDPLPRVVSSSTATRLTEAEIAAIVNHPPTEEL